MKHATTYSFFKKTKQNLNAHYIGFSYIVLIELWCLGWEYKNNFANSKRLVQQEGQNCPELNLAEYESTGNFILFFYCCKNRTGVIPYVPVCAGQKTHELMHISCEITNDILLEDKIERFASAETHTCACARTHTHSQTTWLTFVHNTTYKYLVSWTVTCPTMHLPL